MQSDDVVFICPPVDTNGGSSRAWQRSSGPISVVRRGGGKRASPRWIGRFDVTGAGPDDDQWTSSLARTLMADRTEGELLEDSESSRSDDQEVGIPADADECFGCRRVCDRER